MKELMPDIMIETMMVSRSNWNMLAININGQDYVNPGGRRKKPAAAERTFSIDLVYSYICMPKENMEG